MKRTWILLAVSAMSLGLLTGCAGNADVMPQPSPTTSSAPTVNPATQAPTMQPAATDGPMVSIGPDATQSTGSMTGAGVNSAEDARRVSEQVSDEVDKLSEIDSAEAVVAGSIALVGISYDDQYQGGLTDRLKEMITERVEMIDKAVTTVHVTDEEADVMKISQLYERLKADEVSFEELQTQVLSIGSGIAGGSAPQVNQPKSDTGA